MNNETQSTNAEAQAQEQQHADPAAIGGAAGQGRTFTQDEVNRIISDRLTRERAKAEPPASDREQELNAREAKLACREYIVESDGKYPKELLEVLDTSNFDSFKAQADKLLRAFPGMGTQHALITTGMEHGAPIGSSKDEALARAFRLKK